MSAARLAAPRTPARDQTAHAPLAGAWRHPSSALRRRPPCDADAVSALRSCAVPISAPGEALLQPALGIDTCRGRGFPLSSGPRAQHAAQRRSMLERLRQAKEGAAETGRAACDEERCSAGHAATPPRHCLDDKPAPFPPLYPSGRGAGRRRSMLARSSLVAADCSRRTSSRSLTFRVVPPCRERRPRREAGVRCCLGGTPPQLRSRRCLFVLLAAGTGALSVPRARAAESALAEATFDQLEAFAKVRGSGSDDALSSRCGERACSCARC